LDGPTEVSYCLPGEEETAQWLEDIAKAIRERRLYGFMMQFSAESPVATGEWIEKATQRGSRRARAGAIAFRQRNAATQTD
jgi:hypothetical protein